jgi:2-polyprenyl-6-methoxyphenol hydroxylase-like FAD-dependent oxidoreductase/ankyrin repeat protein
MGNRHAREVEAPAVASLETASPPASSSVPSEPARDVVEAAAAEPRAPGKGAPRSNRLGPDDVVVIAGGGISGLALAAAIQSAPPESRPRVVVLERDPSTDARRQGYGVTLSETNAALAGLGILDELRARNTRSCAHWTFHSSGRVLGYYGAAFLPPERRAPSPWTNLRVPRNEVRETLIARLEPGTVRFRARAVGYEEHLGGKNGLGGHVDVRVETIRAHETFGGGAGRPETEADADAAKTETSSETIRASLLVAADGVRSRVQRQRLPDAELKYLGVVLVTGFTTLRHPLMRGQGFYTVDGERARIFTMPFKSGDAISSKPPLNMWQISVRVSEEEALAVARAPRTGPGGAKEFVERVTRGWHDPVPAMFAEAAWEECWAGPLYDRDEPAPPPKGAAAVSRVVAVGDAAHPMSPFKGMGANSALFDAWALADWLRRAPAPRALACFEREMIARAWVKVRASRDACVSFHSRTVVDAAAEFAGVDPKEAPGFLDELARRGVGAAMGGELEAAAREVLAETRGFRGGERADRGDGVKPYAYLKKKNASDEGEIEAEPEVETEVEEMVDAEAKAKTETETKTETKTTTDTTTDTKSDAGRPSTGSERSCVRKLQGRQGAVPTPDLVALASRAVSEGLRTLDLPPLAAGFESDAASRLVPATFNRRARPAHDWVSRAALKIAHARRNIRDGSNPPDDDSNANSNSNPDAVADVMALARATTEALRVDAEDSSSPAAWARVGADGQILIVSREHARDMASRGLAMCAGCGQFYAAHGGGLRQHWARGGVDQACASAAATAKSAHATDEEASRALGSASVSAALAGSAATETSSWRGKGQGRPGPWRGKASNESRLCAGMAAAAAGDVDGMAAAARDGWDPATATDGYGSGAMHWAAGGGHVAACEWLADERGVSVSATRRKDGRAPLHWAARNGHVDTCRWLAARGADPAALTYDGDGAFNLAVWQGHRETAEWFARQPGVDVARTNRWGCNAVLWACIQHDPSGGGGGGAGSLASKGRDGDGDVSPARGPLPMVRWLIEDLGVSAEVLNVNGHSALHKCAIYGHGDVIAYLLRTGRCADGSKMGPDDRGAAPSDLAAQNGYDALARELREIEDTTRRLPVVFREGGG